MALIPDCKGDREEFVYENFVRFITDRRRFRNNPERRYRLARYLMEQEGDLNTRTPRARSSWTRIDEVD